MTGIDCGEMGMKKGGKQVLDVVWDGMDAVWHSI